MKIAFLTDSFLPNIGGVESHVATLAHELAKRRHSVNIITEPVARTRTRSTFLSSRRIRLVEVPGIREYVYGQNGFQGFIPQLYRVISRLDPDIVHVHNVALCLALAHFVHALSAKFVFTFHSSPVPEKNKIIGYFRDAGLKMEEGFARFIFSDLPYDRLVCASRFYRNWALLSGARENRLILVYHGVDTDRFRPMRNPEFRQSLGFRPGEFVVLSPVRMVERKGILDLLKALSLIKEPPIRLLIATSRSGMRLSFHRKFKEAIKRNGVAQRVRVLYDRIHLDEMPRLYSVADAVVLASHSEGFGLVAAEAMACRKPVIVSKGSGVAELVKNNRNGIIVNAHDPWTLAQSIVRVHQSTALREKISAGGYRLALKHFNSRLQVRKIERVYQTALNVPRNSFTKRSPRSRAVL